MMNIMSMTAHMRRFVAILVSLSVISSSLITGVQAQDDGVRITTFQEPDIKNSFCGSLIDFKYCKCAFHDEYCGNIGMDQSAANAYLYGEFNAWVAGKRQEFVEGCEATGGKSMAGGNECHRCQGDRTWVGSRCLTVEEEQEAKQEELIQEGPLNEDCSIDEADFDANWEKYSDIDEAIPVESRSVPAQKLDEVSTRMAENIIEGFAIEEQMEIDRLARLELRQIREAVVFSTKANLLRAFWRLAYITYMTIGSGKGAGEGYRKIFTADSGVVALGEGIKFVRSNIPASAKEVNFDGSDVGKIKSIAMSAEIEALTSLGDPGKVALNVVDSIGKLPQPSMDISDEEIAILKNHYNQKKVLDDALQESYKLNSLLRRRVMELEQEVAEQQAEIARLRDEEKDRVAFNLTESCKELQADKE